MSNVWVGLRAAATERAPNSRQHLPRSLGRGSAPRGCKALHKGHLRTEATAAPGLGPWWLGRADRVGAELRALEAGLSLSLSPEQPQPQVTHCLTRLSPNTQPTVGNSYYICDHKDKRAGIAYEEVFRDTNKCTENCVVSLRSPKGGFFL